MRMVFVHAHPDDESLWTGLAIAHHAARGDEVHVLTCTLGEEGEVIPEELRHLQLPADQERAADIPDPLAAVRRDELHSAVKELGVSSVTVLADGRYRDSGMAGTPSAAHPRAFTGIDLSESSARIASYLREVRPHVVVTYDAHGGYGHPDHIRTHDATRAAVASLADPPALYSVVTPRSWAIEDRQAALETYFEGTNTLTHDDPYLPSVVPDELVAATVEGDPVAAAAQRAALRCHRTQVRLLDEHFYTLSNDVVIALTGREAFVRLDPATDEPVTDGSRHTGLEP